MHFINWLRICPRVFVGLLSLMHSLVQPASVIIPHILKRSFFITETQCCKCPCLHIFFTADAKSHILSSNLPLFFNLLTWKGIPMPLRLCLCHSWDYEAELKPNTVNFIRIFRYWNYWISNGLSLVTPKYKSANYSLARPRRFPSCTRLLKNNQINNDWNVNLFYGQCQCRAFS